MSLDTGTIICLIAAAVILILCIALACKFCFFNSHENVSHGIKDIETGGCSTGEASFLERNARTEQLSVKKNVVNSCKESIRSSKNFDVAKSHYNQPHTQVIQNKSNYDDEEVIRHAQNLEKAVARYHSRQKNQAKQRRN